MSDHVNDDLNNDPSALQEVPEIADADNPLGLDPGCAGTCWRPSCVDTIISAEMQ